MTELWSTRLAASLLHKGLNNDRDVEHETGSVNPTQKTEEDPVTSDRAVEHETGNPTQKTDN